MTPQEMELYHVVITILSLIVIGLVWYIRKSSFEPVQDYTIYNHHTEKHNPMRFDVHLRRITLVKYKKHFCYKASKEVYKLHIERRNNYRSKIIKIDL